MLGNADLSIHREILQDKHGCHYLGGRRHGKRLICTALKEYPALPAVQKDDASSASRWTGRLPPTCVILPSLSGPRPAGDARHRPFPAMCASRRNRLASSLAGDTDQPDSDK